uniref:Uncharacterized protein n=1 Tax=Timema bartmani TaxID=61472 RepID=A0A7R9I2R8_9NEOP|nr:unnamed protein product [Timema bartmani]
MKLLELYLELVEKESYLVSSTWKGFQISFYVIIIISGLISCISFSNALNDFNLNCMLYSNITFQSVNCDNASQAELPPFDSMKTEFGKQSLCAFCQYAPVCSAIFAFLWAVLFTMCGTGGKTKEGSTMPEESELSLFGCQEDDQNHRSAQGLSQDHVFLGSLLHQHWTSWIYHPHHIRGFLMHHFQDQQLSQPWRIVYPALIFNFMYLIISTTSSVLLEQGHDAFCDSFMVNMNETSCSNMDKYCVSSWTLSQITYAEVRYQQCVVILPGYRFKTASWFNMLAWLLATVLLLLRCSCAADFEVIKITIHTPEPDHDDEAPQLPFIDGASSSKETVREEEVTNVRLERHN